MKTWKKYLFGIIILLILSSGFSQGTIRVGVYHNPPKIIISEEGGVSGFHATIIQTIANQQGWEIEYVNGSWNEGLERLTNNEIDLMVDVAYTQDRTGLYDFNNEPVLENWGLIYSSITFSPESILDLNNKRIGVMINSTHTFYFTELADSFNINVELVEFNDYTEVFQAISSGLVDAGVVNRLFGSTFESDYSVKKTNIVFNPVQIRYALTKGELHNSEIIQGLDEVLIRLKSDENSVYYVALNEMFGTAFDWSPIISIAGSVLFLIIIIILGLIVRNTVLNREIILKEEMDRLRQGFIAITTHDLKQPLVPIKGYIKLLEDNIKDKENKEYLKEMKSCSEDILAKINTILDVFKLEAGEIKFNFKNKDISKPIKEVIDSKKSNTKIKKIKIIKNIKKVIVPHDYERIKQLINNLLDNAIKFSKKEGIITVKNWSDKDKAYISIKDNGIGIKKEEIPKLFTHFYQTEEGKKAGGSGIGLTMINEIVKAHGGSIEVKSEYGKGAEFIISLPF